MQNVGKDDGGKQAFVAAMKAVFWSFFGVRKRSAYERDATQLDPLQLILAALVGVSLFIGTLVILVRIAVAA